MSRPQKITVIVLASIGALIVALFVAGVIYVQTPSFRNMVREKIVSSLENATGGRAEVGSCSFDLSRMRAGIHNLVVHGNEPAGAAPLFRAPLVQVGLSLASPASGYYHIDSLTVDRPQANVIVYPDGRTNIPTPKVKPSGNPVQTVVDMSIGHFDLRNGSVRFADRKMDFNARGENLRAQLAYNDAHDSYTGEIDMSPLYLQSDNNTAVNAAVKLPLTIQANKVVLSDALVTTPASRISATATIANMAAPVVSGHLVAHVSLEEAGRASGLEIALGTANAPKYLNADITASMSHSGVEVRNAKLDLGQTTLTASGTAAEPNRPADIRFDGTLALGQLGRLFAVSAQPEGTVQIGGNAVVQSASDYHITANVAGKNFAFRHNQTRVSGVNLDAALTAGPQLVQFGGVRLAAFGGNFTGSATVRNGKEFHVAGDLHHFDLDRFARVFLHKNMTVQGDVSGPIEATGPVSKPSDMVLHANLTIDPPQTPIHGHLNLTYNGAAGSLTFTPSTIRLAHTTLAVSGSLATGLRVHVVSHDLSDLHRFVTLPVRITGGSGVMNVVVTGTLASPHIAGQVAFSNFEVDKRRFQRFEAAVNLSQSYAAVSNAVLTRGPMVARFTGEVGLHDWKPLPGDLLRVNGTVNNGRIEDFLALAGYRGLPLTGALAADLHIDGTVGSPAGNADFTLANGTLEGSPFDTISGRAIMTATTIEVPNLQYVAGPSRLTATATYRHAVNDLERGSLSVRLAGNGIQLANFQALLKGYGPIGGIVSVSADVGADIQPSSSGAQFQLTALNGTVSAGGLEMEGKPLGNVTASAKTVASAVHYNLHSDFAGSKVLVNGQTLLTGNHETAANVSVADLPVGRALAVAGRGDIPLSGTLSATAQLAGTLQNPRATANMDIANGSVYREPFNSLEAGLTYTNQLIEVPHLQVVKGGSNIQLAGSYAHPAGNYSYGQLRFELRSNELQLSRFRTVQEYRPGLNGIVEVSADGAATLRGSAMPLFSSLNGSLEARQLEIGTSPLGDLTATAQTRGGEVALHLASNLGGASIRGDGTVRLAGDYPIGARLKFSNLTYAGLRPVTGAPEEPIRAAADGWATITGPLTKIDQVQARLELTKLEVKAAPAQTGMQPRVQFDLRNAAPIAIALDRSVVTIQRAYLIGPYATFSLSGAAALTSPKTLNLRANGHVDLHLLEAFNPNVFSAGAVTLNATVAGTLSKPAVNGRVELQNASYNALGIPAGLDHANGAIVFTGMQAVFQNISAQSGGGKVTIGGYVAYGGPRTQFRVQATAAHVHLVYPQSLMTQASAKLVLAGTSAASLVSGDVTIEDISLQAQTDIGSILTSTIAPAPVLTVPSVSLLAGMRLDVKIKTAPGVQFRTTLTQNLQADANLTLRGTADQPGMLGRIVVTAGSVVFFGNQYTINTGTITFYDPHNIEPNLNINLETRVQGIDVTISVSGPMDRLKLSYRSEPPLQFSQVVALLAAGTPPTTDPVLAAHQPAVPEQSFAQAGASALLGQAVASPVAGRLQHLFGVTQLSVNPEITGFTNTAQATITLQQMITPDITFTYIQDVAQANAEVLRVQWALNPQWMAVAQRDIYGEFDLDFYYKKRFK